ncbi:MAG: LapA family protein [Sphingobacteriales bacterium]|nr:MAG: LapA family protein [Sphingobacteriales bacterium]
MGFKTIFIIAISVFITVLFMQNTDEASFKLIFTTVSISKTFMLAIVLIIGFVLGLMLSGKKTDTNNEYKKSYQNIPLEIENTYNEDQEYISMNHKKGLSEEDKDYIN